MRGILVFLAFALVLSSAAPGAESALSKVEVYRVPFTDPDVMEQTVRAIVGPQASVVLDRKGNRLIVSGTDAQHAQIRELVEKLNQPPRNVRIEVRFEDDAAEDRFEAGVGGGVAVVYDGDEVGGRVRVEPHLRQSSVTRTSRTTQSLLTASGAEAVLKVGEAVPYLDYLLSYGRRGARVEQSLQWQDVGSYLYIQPTVLPDGKTVRVKLTPALSGQAGSEPHRLRYNELATEVVVREGESIRLGGQDQHGEFYARFLVGVDRGGQRRQLDIILTPRIVEPGVP